MGRTAFIFPGQGAQYAGMGKDFYEQIPLCRQVMDMAGEIAELDLKKLCFEENEQLHITEFTQIAMIAVEAAILKALEAEGIRPQVAAGLSLGEYGAVLAAGVLSMEDTFSVVRKRGIYMQEAVPEGGAMSAVLGLSGEQVEQICEKEPGMVSVANYNCPGQVVITGEARAVENASEKLKDAGARRVLPLKVSGPFHSPMLKKAEERLRETLKEISIQKPWIPYAANVTAKYVTEAQEVKELLARQVSSPVKWQQCVETMLADQVDTFIEVGPGKTLSGFMRKIDRNVRVLNIQTLEDFQTVVKALKER